MSGPASGFPGQYDVLIGDRAFKIDTSYEAFRRQSFHHDTIPAQREALELTDVPGEGTVNTEGLWRRGGISFHHGAGQLYADRKESDPYRFLASLNVDCSNENQLTLLPACTLRVDDSSGDYGNTAKVLAVNGTLWTLETTIPAATGPYTYRLRYAPDWSTWTVPSGIPANNVTDLATDGTNIYIAGFYGDGAGVWMAQPSGEGWGEFFQIISGSVERVWYVGDRLFCAYGPYLYDATAATNDSGPYALNSTQAYAVFQHPNPNWHWEDMTAGEAFVYASGNVLLSTENLQAANLGESAVYSFTTSPGEGGITSTVSLAGSGSVAYLPPFGEQINALLAYEDYVFMGGNQGVRCARTVSQYDPSGSAGSLISGPLLPNMTAPFQAPFQPYTGAVCAGFVGGGRWVWFLWPAYSYGGTTYWGLGRCDLGNFVSQLQPAYVSDLMVASSVVSSDVQTGCVFWDPVSNGPGFVLPGGGTGAGIYTADYNVSITDGYKYCETGYMRSGKLTYGMQDNKTVAQANLKSGATNLYAPFDTANGTITLNVNYDDGGFNSLAPLAPNTQANPPVLVSPLTPAEEIEVEAVLGAGTTTYTDDSRPFLNRWTIKALPNVVSGIYIYVALQLYRENEMQGTTDFSDPYGDYAYLENLRLSQTIISYEEAPAITNSAEGFSATCVVEEIYWMPQQKVDTAVAGFEGVAVVTLKTLVG